MAIVFREFSIDWLSYAWRVRKADHREPECANSSHGREEPFQVHRLGDVTVGMEGITLHDIYLCRRGGQDHDRNADECCALLYLAKNFPAIFLRQIEIEQDQVGTRCVRVLPFTPQERHCLYSIPRDVQPNRHFDVLKCFLDEPDVAGTVFHQKNFHRGGGFHQVHHWSSLTGSAKQKLDPLRGCDSSEIGSAADRQYSFIRPSLRSLAFNSSLSLRSWLGF